LQILKIYFATDCKVVAMVLLVDSKVSKNKCNARTSDVKKTNLTLGTV